MAKKGTTPADLKAMGLVEVSPGVYRKGTVTTEKKHVANTMDGKKIMLVKVKEIFIPYDVRSSKNSKRIIQAGDRPSIIDSAATEAYRVMSTKAYDARRQDFLEMINPFPKPYFIALRFARATKQTWDFHNICQVVYDMMQERAWIDDDDVENMIPVYLPHFQDKHNPGVYISVLPNPYL